MHSQGKTLVLRAIFMIIYGFVGAAIFTLVEKRDESNKTTSNRLLKELRKNFTKHQNISDEEFQILTMAVYKAVRVGLSADWTYFRAVDFTYTALTTIGMSYYFTHSQESIKSKGGKLPCGPDNSRLEKSQ